MANETRIERNRERERKRDIERELVYERDGGGAGGEANFRVVNIGPTHLVHRHTDDDDRLKSNIYALI